MKNRALPIALAAACLGAALVVALEWDATRTESHAAYTLRPGPATGEAAPLRVPSEDTTRRVVVAQVPPAEFAEPVAPAREPRVGEMIGRFGARYSFDGPEDVVRAAFRVRELRAKLEKLEVELDPVIDELTAEAKLLDARLAELEKELHGPLVNQADPEASGADFAAAYAGHSLEDLAVARWKLRLTERRECERLAEERFAAGLYSSEIEDHHTIWRSSGDPPLGLTRLVALGPDGAGPWERRSVDLSPEEHPELHALRRERRWVEGRLRD